MNKQSLSYQDSEIHQIIKRLFAYYNNRERKIAAAYYKKGGTQDELAKELGVSPSAVRMHFPYKKLLESNDVSQNEDR